MLLYVIMACSWWGDDVVAGPEPVLPTLGAREGTTAEEVAREIELLPTKGFVDFMDLGTAHLWTGEYLRATEEYEIAARQARTEDELVAALYAKAGAAGYAGHMKVALQTADLLVRLRPDNAEAAWLRFGLYQHSGDALGLVVARDHVLRADPGASGHEVMEPISTAVVVGVVIVAGMITMGTVVYLTPPEDRRDVALAVVRGLTEVGTTAVGGPLAAPRAGIDLGRAIATGW